jgi:acetylornithine deacetylase
MHGEGLDMDSMLIARIKQAVADGFDRQCAFLSDLVCIPSQRGEERRAQEFMAAAYASEGYPVDMWKIDVEQIRSLPGFSPVAVSYDDAYNVVARYAPRVTKGRSLILNGHIDVVPTGPREHWTRDPYEPAVRDGWMYGRGAGDMKAGLSACLYALKALKSLGVQPAAEVFLQSVVEEECTGNGALACLARGYRAEGAFIPEPLEPKLLRAQVGPIWFEVQVDGDPQHASGAFTAGSNAIEKAFLIIEALKRLEQVWNARKADDPHFHDHPHPIRFNLGKIAGGDWTSSVPAWCRFEMRVATYPAQNLKAACAELEACIAEAARADSFLANRPPKVVYNGFLAEGYVLSNAEDLEAALRRSHVAVWNAPLQEHVTSATTDARFFGLYADTPAIVYGPICRMPHGYDEAVDLDSVLKVTQTLALFVADWCSLEPLSEERPAS